MNSMRDLINVVNEAEPTMAQQMAKGATKALANNASLLAPLANIVSSLKSNNPNPGMTEPKSLARYSNNIITALGIYDSVDQAATAILDINARAGANKITQEQKVREINAQTAMLAGRILTLFLGKAGDKVFARIGERLMASPNAASASIGAICYIIGTFGGMSAVTAYLNTNGSLISEQIANFLLKKGDRSSAIAVLSGTAASAYQVVKNALSDTADAAAKVDMSKIPELVRNLGTDSPTGVDDLVGAAKQSAQRNMKTTPAPAKEKVPEEGSTAKSEDGLYDLIYRNGQWEYQ